MLGLCLNGTAPIYEQLTNRIEQLVLSGVLAPDEILPSVRELATELAVNPNTVQRAYAMLEEKGVTYSVGGKGRFVTSDVEKLRARKKSKSLETLEKSLEAVKNEGITLEEALEFTRKFFEKE